MWRNAIESPRSPQYNREWPLTTQFYFQLGIGKTLDIKMAYRTMLWFPFFCLCPEPCTATENKLCRLWVIPQPSVCSGFDDRAGYLNACLHWTQLLSLSLSVPGMVAGQLQTQPLWRPGTSQSFTESICRTGATKWSVVDEPELSHLPSILQPIQGIRQQQMKAAMTLVSALPPALTLAGQ